MKQLDSLELAPVTYFVGENGSGKSTILEAIAVAAGFNAEGGTKNFNFATRPSESILHAALRLSRTRREKAGFFLRAESFFNVATQIDETGRPLHPSTSRKPPSEAMPHEREERLAVRLLVQ